MTEEEFKEYKRIVNSMADNLKDAYEIVLDRRTTHLKKNIVRKINLPMSSYCEEEVALVASKILGDEYNFLIDVNLPCNRKKKYRPDIVIIKRVDENTEYLKNLNELNEIVEKEINKLFNL